MDACKKLCVILSLFFFYHANGQSQVAPISISFQDQPLLEALAQIDELTTLQLSFNPQILPQDKVISQSFHSQPPEEILKEMLGTQYDLKTIGNYLIIQKKIAKKEKTTFKIAGGVTDAVTGEELEDVSIYEINSLESTLTNDQGEFVLKAKTGADAATFLISRKDYKDTIIHISAASQITKPIALSQEKDAKLGKAIRDQVKVFSEGLAKLFTSKKVIKNAQNVNMVDTRMFQLSLIPSVGTNRKMSSQIKNRVSLNLLAGYGYGVRGFEMGGVYNINREEVRGAQIGGLGNTVGGEVHGLQMAGFINTTKDYVKGTQIGGFINVASDSVNGFQMAGFTNLTKEVKGFQIAGFNNHTQKSSGYQLSGFINTTKEMDGLQMAGFINVAEEVRGMQFSFINVADTIASGIPLGFLNFVKRGGLFSPGIESDDVVPYLLTLRSGLDKFYSVLSIGSKPQEFWTLGVGFGSKLYTGSKRKFHLNPELRWINLAKNSSNDRDNNFLVRFNLNMGYQIFKHFTITSGPALNFYYTNQLDESGTPEVNIAGDTYLDETSGNIRYQLWLGYTFGIHF